MKSKWLLGTLGILTTLGGCENEPVMVGENKEALEVNKVDILFVVDDSASMEGVQAKLPELLESFIAGSDEPGEERPELTDIHLATVSTNMGIGDTEGNFGIEQCNGLGNDGVFIGLSSADLAQCNPDMTGFIEYEDGVGEITTEVAAACLPTAGTDGCGFEHPLEAMLKALWPSSKPGVEFLEGEGHGDGDNGGFLREDSLLVVVIVSDEDDCSAQDLSIFVPAAHPEGLNTRCVNDPNALFDVGRYVQGLKDLREGDDPILFVTIAGVPADLAEAQGDVDLNDTEAVDAYYDEILDDDAMQITIDDRDTPAVLEDDGIVPSCEKPREPGSDFAGLARPPRRLVQVAKAFGSAGVIGSVCADDFGSTIGGVIRATAERL